MEGVENNKKRLGGLLQGLLDILLKCQGSSSSGGLVTHEWSRRDDAGVCCARWAGAKVGLDWEGGSSYLLACMHAV